MLHKDFPMGRRSVFYALFAATTLFGAGCASTGQHHPIAWMGLAHKKSDAKQNAESDEPSPFEPEGSTKGDDSTETKLAESSVKQQDKIETPKFATSHDAETLKLIDDELKDATADEREQLFQDFKGMDPQFVRQFLRMRRMVMRMGQNTVGESSVVKSLSDQSPGRTDAQPAQHPPAASVANASGDDNGFGHTLNGQPSFPTAVSPGLGNVTPWDRPATEQPQSPVMASTNGTRQPSSQQAYYAPQPPIAPPPAGYNGRPAPAFSTDPQSSTGPATMARSQPSGASAVSAPIARTLAAPFGTPQQAVSVTANAAESRMGPAANRPPIPAVPASATVERDHGGMFLPARFTGQIAAGAQNAALNMPAGFATPLMSAGEGAVAASTWDQDLQRVIAGMEAQVAELTPGSSNEESLEYIQRHVFLRALYLMSGQQERALTAIPGIGAADQEFWQQVFWSVTNYFDANAIPDPSDRATQTIVQLSAAMQRLQENAKLEIPTAAFCKKILSYGDYEKLPRDEFRPGQPVLLYAEVRNFKSEPTADWKYRTLLRSWIDIHKYRADGQADLVETTKFPVSEDLCRNQRRDYFHSYEFSIPQRISPGPHVLKLFVEDMLNQKIATYSVNFTVN